MTLDPNIRKKLLKESMNPYQGIRRLAWLVLSASAGIGLLIMGMRFTSGEVVLIKDIFIQVIAFSLFGSLVFFDRDGRDVKN